MPPVAVGILAACVGLGVGIGRVGYVGVGTGCEGAGIGAGELGATGPEEMDTSAQFQNCSVDVGQ